MELGGASMRSMLFAEQYSVSITKKAMAQEEMAAKEFIDMLPQIPQTPAVPKGEYIDIYV